MALSDFFLSVDSNDKAKNPFGNPGRAIDTIARPHGRILAAVDQPKIGEALDHSYHHGSITTSANIHQIIPARL
jgi:hypothetical protein